MKKCTAYILLVLFSSFLACTSVDFSRYLQLLSTGANTEDVSSFPEEQHEDTQKIKKHFHVEHLLASTFLAGSGEYSDAGHFSLSENIYFEVPHSPPDGI